MLSGSKGKTNERQCICSLGGDDRNDYDSRCIRETNTRRDVAVLSYADSWPATDADGRQDSTKTVTPTPLRRGFLSP